MLGLGIVSNLLGGVLNVATTHLESKAVVRKARV